MILLVEATDEAVVPLAQFSGPTIPAWGGEGDPGGGYYAGLPGTVYARVLQELWTEVSPTGAYWNPTREASDNRLSAFETDRVSLEFSEPDSAPGGDPGAPALPARVH